jgi:hypothetical protein
MNTMNSDLMDIFTIQSIQDSLLRLNIVAN